MGITSSWHSDYMNVSRKACALLWYYVPSQAMLVVYLKEDPPPVSFPVIPTVVQYNLSR